MMNGCTAAIRVGSGPQPGYKQKVALTVVYPPNLLPTSVDDATRNLQQYLVAEAVSYALKHIEKMRSFGNG